jgi:glutamyl-tRNA synthetase
VCLVLTGPLRCALLRAQSWVNGVGKAQKRKGKRLFMPMRIALTGRMAGPDVGEQLEVLAKIASPAEIAEADAYVPVPERLAALKSWLAAQK